MSQPAMPFCFFACPDVVVMIGIGGGWYWSPHITVGGSSPFATILPIPPAGFDLWPIAEFDLMSNRPDLVGDYFRDQVKKILGGK